MNLVPVAYKSIRLTIVIFSSNNCQTKVHNCQTIKFKYNEY